MAASAKKKLAVLLLAVAAAIAGVMVFRQVLGTSGKTGESAVPRVTTSVLTLGDGVGLTLARVGGGRFFMGAGDKEPGAEADERPLHEVSVSPFWLGATEVTVAQFAVFVKQSGYGPAKHGAVRSLAVGPQGLLIEDPGGHSWQDPGFRQEPDHPVVFVTHFDATAFCLWLSEKTGVEFSLPTEAQWECAARAGTSSSWHWGDAPEGGRGFINGPDITARKTFPLFGEIFEFEDGFIRTAPVMSFSPNVAGLYDMHGNAAEWCADWFDPSWYSKNPEKGTKGPERGVFRVFRGGSWAGIPESTRSAARAAHFPAVRSNDIGFRVACEKLPPEAAPGPAARPSSGRALPEPSAPSKPAGAP